MDNTQGWTVVEDPGTAYGVDLLYKHECYEIVGLAFTVHNALGKGFLEKVYKEAMEIEFKLNDIDYSREKKFEISYKNHVLSAYYADFVVYDKIILEIKATDAVLEEHVAQTLNYLAASKCKLAIILDFGGSKLKYKRVVL